eukprot:CAMPEP_0181139312 /NCGR_PEP_ID=MMETSP1071-20121207/34716_1 /TAXON_ID=35127 /ORGANISM="Thalassiosira sp., Strain NH16" /LENGTH=97 /DNA_ID=CAMNT_0023226213 /DNA_START=8 /DNA_END=301 /DNA_ORIENTATION=-
MTPLSYDLAHYVMLPKMLCYKRVNMRAVRHKIGIFDNGSLRKFGIALVAIFLGDHLYCCGKTTIFWPGSFLFFAFMLKAFQTRIAVASTEDTNDETN